MARAMSIGRKDVLALSRDTAALARCIDIRRIARNRSLHIALALANLAFAVAFVVAQGAAIGPITGAAFCLSAACVAVMVLFRAAESGVPASRPDRSHTGVGSLARGRTARQLGCTTDGAQRDLTGLLAMMSHELRTPLNAIIGNADAIRYETLGPASAARYRDCAAHIREGGQLLLRATEDMLALTGAVATATFAPHRPADLEDIVRDALRNATETAKSKGVDLSWQSATDRAVLCDDGALHHAITRIIDGALARATSGSGIHVELTQGRSTVELMLTLTHGDNEARDRAAQIDAGSDRSPAALQVAVARTLLTLLGTHLHTAHGIDGRWRAIVELPMAL